MSIAGQKLRTDIEASRNAKRAKDLEEAIKFGEAVQGIDFVFNTFMIILKRCDKTYVATLSDMFRKQVHEMIVKPANEKYAGIETAERAKKYALERLAEFEKAAKPYLK